MDVHRCWHNRESTPKRSGGALAGGGTLSVDDLFSFLHQPVLAQVSITLIHFEKAILESPDFVVYVHKYVYVFLICQDVSPLTRILLFWERGGMGGSIPGPMPKNLD